MADLSGAHGTASFVKTDVSIDSQVREVVKQTLESHGRIDILVVDGGWTAR